MARVPYVSRDELNAEGQEIYDRIRRDRNAPEVGLQCAAGSRRLPVCRSPARRNVWSGSRPTA
jgi:hypothetical protein